VLFAVERRPMMPGKIGAHAAVVAAITPITDEVIK
jgi:hypothetical protein